ncbi:MAG: IS701 family transposase, partial [Campylobacterales bacterium]|nr:IS701 family transposase [Campylobacterales bacterium]
MKNNYLELYTDYLISNSGLATATGLSAMMNNTISHDKVTRFLNSEEFDSKQLWLEAKKTIRHIESEDGYLIFDDTIQEKVWTDKN